MARTALIAGSTGLVGKDLLNLLLQSDRYQRVIAITRRRMDLQHSKLVQLIADLSTLPSSAEGMVSDDVFCCLGTTMAKAGSREKFYEADYQYPLELAKITHSKGAKQYLIVSAMGANAASGIFYNRVKGEVEGDLQKVGFQSVHIFRPSLLLGERSESRPGESIAQAIFKAVPFLIPKKYKGVPTSAVAKAMLAEASKDSRGVFIHESDTIQKYVAKQ